MSDPWSRRQNPIKIPKIPFHRRYPRFTSCCIIVGGLSIFFSRLIYDAFFRKYFQPETIRYVDVRYDQIFWGKNPNKEANMRDFAERMQNKPKTGL